MQDPFGAKYDSQVVALKAIDKMFFKKLAERDNFIKNNQNLYADKIRSLDLDISICIQKRAKITKGGYNYILNEMWDWHPHFSLDNKLLPKTVRK